MDNKIYTYVNGEEGQLPYENAHLILPIERMEEICELKPAQVEPKYLRTTRVIERLYDKMQWWMVVVRQDHENNVGIDYVRKAPADDPTYSYADIAFDNCGYTLREICEYFESYMSKYRFNKIAGIVKNAHLYTEKADYLADVARGCIGWLEENERKVAESIIKEIADMYGLQSMTERYWRLDEKRRAEGWGF